MRWTNNPYFTVLEKINLLQRWIVVHSIIYYEHNTSIVSDKMFDDNCKQLVTMMQEHDKELKMSRLYYCMADFDGSTGFDLPSSLNKRDYVYLSSIAKHVIKMYGGAK